MKEDVVSQFDVEHFISACQLDSSFVEELKRMSLYKVIVQQQSNRVVVAFNNEDLMSFELYSQLHHKLKQFFKLPILLTFDHGYPIKDFKTCSLWMSYVLKTLKLPKIVPFYQLKDNMIIGVVSDPSHVKTLIENKEKIEEKLKEFGIDMLFDTQLAVNQTNEKEVKYQATPAVEKPKSPQKYRRSKQPAVAVTISQLEESLSNVSIEGYVYSIETRTLSQEDQMIQMFVLSDGEDAISVKRFLKGKQQIDDSQELKEQSKVTCIGNVQFDRFKKEIGFVANQINIESSHVYLKDNAPKKRIEFHTHTKMSEMDAVSDVQQLIHQAIAYGHRGLAITDHVNVQAFPKAEALLYKLKKKKEDLDFKLVYGVEMNMVDDQPNIVTRPTSDLLDDIEYVIFDLETTGLSAQYDHIIEFGAIKVKNQEIIGEYLTFIKPPVSISSFISSKTNISNNDVKDAPSIEDELDKILEFIKGSVLVAHNAQFDVSFLSQVCDTYKRPSITQPVIDTLELSRVLLIERKSFRLGRVARAFSIAYDEDVAHRADYDVKITNKVFSSLLLLAKEQGIKTLEDLSNLNHEESFKNMMKSHVQVIAKNQAGLVDMFRLVSISHMETLAFYKKANNKKEVDEFMAEARIKRGVLKTYRKHLLIGAGCLNNEIFEIAANRTVSQLEAALAFYDYVEVQPLGHYQPLIDRNVIPNQDRLIMIIQSIIKAANKQNIPVLATGDVHFVHPKDKIFREIMIASQGIGGIRHPLYMYDQQKRLASVAPDQYFMSTEVMLQEFSFLDIDVAYELVVEAPNRLFYTIEPIEIIKKELFTPKIEHADENLTDLVYKHAYAKYGDPMPKRIEKRVKQELDAIKSNGFGVIYYIAHLLVKKSLDDGYLVGSRGSVGSSLVAHLADITEVNPLAPHYCCPKCHAVTFVEDETIGSGFDLENKQCDVCHVDLIMDGQDIPFETFLGFEGDKVPDIDLNFSNQYQEHAHAYTKELFGEKNVYRAGTIGTIAARTAYGYAKGYAEEMQLPADIRDARWSWYASGVEGVKRTTGQHPGGIIVVPDDMEIYEFTPVQFPANNPDSAWKTTHFEFADIHDNLLKLDILGHLDPSAMKLLEEITGIDPTTINMNDPKVMSIFSDISALNVDQRYTNEVTGAIGLPEFGTTFVREILKIAQPKNFSDLVRISGLSHGTDVWLNNAKDIILSGKTLSDVIGCRDDIMVYLIQKGLKPKQAFDIMESVRKGKGLTVKWIDLMKKNQVDNWYIDSCQKIKYMFPKAHAVAYVIMAVRIAWYKVYYPLAYYISYFTLRANAFDVDVMLSDAASVSNKLSEISRRLKDPNEKFSVSNKEKELYNTLEVVLEMKLRGYGFTTIDLYKSKATEFALDSNNDKAILLPYAVLDGLGANVAKSVVAAREEAPFLSKEDLVNRTQLNYNHIKKLDSLGSLDELQEENQCSLF
jgi:DNA polymerase-3 subunit alpha (Gram-positive type)